MDCKSETILLPVVQVGCGTRTAAVRDAAGRTVRFGGVETLTLIGPVLHLELPVVGRRGPLAEVALPDGRRVWVPAAADSHRGSAA